LRSAQWNKSSEVRARATLLCVHEVAQLVVAAGILVAAAWYHGKSS
jgi:hypothetical protein